MTSGGRGRCCRWRGLKVAFIVLIQVLLLPSSWALWGGSPSPPVASASASIGAGGIGGGTFFDLAGCLTAAPCSGTAAIFLSTRLVLGEEPFLAHLDLLYLAPSSAAVLVPYSVLAVSFQVAPAIVVTPYLGVAPVLATASAPPHATDWLIKLGDHFSFGGLAAFVEVAFPIPLAPVPALALGFLLEF